MNEIERAIELVTTSITFSYIDKDKIQSKAVPLEGGIAVLLDDIAAYWVKDEVVYAANGMAKMYSREIKYVPNAEIDYAIVNEKIDNAT